MLEKDPHSDMGTERVAMGQWMADYLDDAGYETWYVQPTIYKMLFMNAFPAIDKLDNKKVYYRKLDTADLENLNIKFLRWPTSTSRSGGTNCRSRSGSASQASRARSSSRAA